MNEPAVFGTNQEKYILELNEVTLFIMLMKIKLKTI